MSFLSQHQPPPVETTFKPVPQMYRYAPQRNPSQQAPAGFPRDVETSEQTGAPAGAQAGAQAGTKGSVQSGQHELGPKTYGGYGVPPAPQRVLSQGRTVREDQPFSQQSSGINSESLQGRYQSLPVGQRNVKLEPQRAHQESDYLPTTQGGPSENQEGLHIQTVDRQIQHQDEQHSAHMADRDGRFRHRDPVDHDSDDSMPSLDLAEGRQGSKVMQQEPQVSDLWSKKPKDQDRASERKSRWDSSHPRAHDQRPNQGGKTPDQGTMEGKRAGTQGKRPGNGGNLILKKKTEEELAQARQAAMQASPYRPPAESSHQDEDDDSDLAIRFLSQKKDTRPARRISPEREKSPVRFDSPEREMSPVRFDSPEQETSMVMSQKIQRSPARFDSPEREMYTVTYDDSMERETSPIIASQKIQRSPARFDTPERELSSDRSDSPERETSPIIASQKIQRSPARFDSTKREMYSTGFDSPERETSPIITQQKIQQSPARFDSPEREKSPVRFDSPERKKPTRFDSPEREKSPVKFDSPERSPVRFHSPERERLPVRFDSPERERSPVRFDSPERKSPPLQLDSPEGDMSPRDDYDDDDDDDHKDPAVAFLYPKKQTGPAKLKSPETKSDAKYARLDAPEVSRKTLDQRDLESLREEREMAQSPESVYYDAPEPPPDSPVNPQAPYTDKSRSGEVKSSPKQSRMSPSGNDDRLFAMLIIQNLAW